MSALCPIGGRGYGPLPEMVASPQDDLVLAPKSAFRVALAIPLCGSAGLWAPSCIASAQLAVAELNRGRGIRGRPVDLVMIDSAVEAQVPVDALLNSLIELGAVDAIVGMHISAIRQRLSKIVQNRIPYIYTPLYEGGERTPGIFAIGETPSEQVGPAMERLQRCYRPRRWAMIGNDYVWPRTSHGYAKQYLQRMGVALVHERYLPFGHNRMEDAIAALATSRADALLLSLVGQDAVDFNRAFGEAGLDRQMFRLCCAVEENGLLAIGSENLKRLFSASSYFGALRTEANACFRESYHSFHGDRAPMLNALGQSTYEGLHFLHGLLERDPEAWRDETGSMSSQLTHRSARWQGVRGRPAERPIYLARADGMLFSIGEKLT
ncbi:MAG: amino acid/amide ABC transporter substrate-binding protein, HAAT family [Rhodobacteraceae bacterium HLUCCA12]|nr:MAG: amino acid/amide ABC transporter substrate-binding protein, HAAT family [Rhodobacteraceae bacterium HLUCCA12]